MIVAPQRVTAAGNRTRLTVLSDHVKLRHRADCLVSHIYSGMTEQHQKLHLDWPALLQRIRRELDVLSEADRTWLKERLVVIEATQLALDELFCKAGGVQSCAGCDGECCGCGRHHITLTNLLAYLLVGEDPPAPDFSRTCPYLGDQGCLLPVSRRPYNCITFFCETLEDQLNSVDSEQLRTLDRRLRNEYQRVEERYPAASLRGLWIALERVGDGQLLCSSENMVK